MVITQEALTEVKSLYAEAYKEALKHRWIKSEKHGRDLGDHAVRDWYRRFWRPYCRYHHIQHLGGCCCWREFGESNFGGIYSLILRGDLLVDRILDRVCDGQENLDVIFWAFEWGLPINRVVDILAQIDMNRGRLDPNC